MSSYLYNDKAKYQVQLGSFLADPTRHQESSQGDDRSTLLCPTVPSKCMSGRGKMERENRVKRGKKGTSATMPCRGRYCTSCDMTKCCTGSSHLTTS